jgi:hypothetical protein
LAIGLENSTVRYGFRSRFIMRNGLKKFSKYSECKQIDYYLPYYLVPENVSRNRVTIACLTHFEPENSFKNLGWKRAQLQSDFFVAISDLTYEAAIRNGVPKNRIKLIRYGVDKKYKPCFNILIVGSPGKRKGVNFLRKLQSILDSESDIQWRSASESGWGLKTLCRDASNLSLAYDWADLLVVPSELEGAHTGTLEAIESGLKVLTRPTGWAYSELRNLVEIRNTEEEMAQVILGLKSQKMDGPTLAKKELNDMGFSYDNWRTEHSKLFSSFFNS